MGIITAHSGCDGTEDNSLEFISYALASGADCLEVDVRPDKEGSLILSHDESDGENVKLEQVFTLLGQNPEKKINCDLKTKGLEIPVYQLACRFHVEKQLIYSGDVDPVQLSERKNEFEKAVIFLNIENIYPDVYRKEEKERFGKLKQAIEKASKLPVSCINMEYHILTEEIVEYMKRNGLGCSAWTVNDETEIGRLLKSGVNNITTRNLRGALKVKKEMEQE